MEDRIDVSIAYNAGELEWDITTTNGEGALNTDLETALDEANVGAEDIIDILEIFEYRNYPSLINHLLSA